MMLAVGSGGSGVFVRDTNADASRVKVVRKASGKKKREPKVQHRRADTNRKSYGAMFGKDAAACEPYRGRAERRGATHPQDGRGFWRALHDGKGEGHL
jgi:hypothetical protein